MNHEHMHYKLPCLGEAAQRVLLLLCRSRNQGCACQILWLFTLAQS